MNAEVTESWFRSSDQLWRAARGYCAKAEAALRLLARRPAVAPTPCDVVYRCNKLQLLRYRSDVPAGSAAAARAPVLCLPSLINRHYILDLMRGRSLVGYLVGQGHDVYLVDWGRPAAEDRYVTFDAYVTQLLDRCVDRTAALSRTARVTLLGYCMGGTMAAIYAALFPHKIRNLVTLAAPVDFSRGGLLGQWTDKRYFDPDRLVDAFGNVPWPLMQVAFHLLVPTLVLQKARALYDRLDDDAFVDHFLSLERWGGDNVAFPGECFRRYVKELYQDNRLIDDRLQVGARRVRLGAVEAPLLNVVAHGDHIVPVAAAKPLSERVGSSDRQLWELPGGHIGAIVSRTAARDFWPRLSKWLRAR